MNGDELVKRLRNKGCATPVLMLTARDELPHKVAGFRAGADDYLTKPFALAELEVRLGSRILRSKGARARSQRSAICGSILATQEVSRARRGAVQLYAGGKKLLEELMRASPAVVTKNRLESLLWGDDPPDGDMLRSHIYELRKSIDGSFAEKLIHTGAEGGLPDGAARALVMAGRSGLRQRITIAALAYLLLVAVILSRRMAMSSTSALSTSCGNRCWRVSWSISTRRLAAEPSYRFADTETLKLYGPHGAALPPEFASLSPGVHDELRTPRRAIRCTRARHRPMAATCWRSTSPTSKAGSGR